MSNCHCSICSKRIRQLVDVSYDHERLDITSATTFLNWAEPMTKEHAVATRQPQTSSAANTPNCDVLADVVMDEEVSGDISFSDDPGT